MSVLKQVVCEHSYRVNGMMIRHRDYFVYLLVLSAFLITFAIGFESFLQKHLPDRAMLAQLHGHGLFTDYKVQYEPNKGIWHVMGWAGIFLMLIMHVYTFRKKVRVMHEWGMLKHWLDFHMFCGVMGPILITFHTTFKLGGIVAVSYWSLVIVALSGLFGRYVYGMIPRGIAGNELRMEELEQLNKEITDRIEAFYLRGRGLRELLQANITVTTWDDQLLRDAVLNMFKDLYRGRLELKRLSGLLKHDMQLPRKERDAVIKTLRQRLQLNRRINFLSSAHRLLRYWHLFHMFFTAAMFLIAVIHIVVYYIFRVNA